MLDFILLLIMNLKFIIVIYENQSKKKIRINSQISNMFGIL